METLDRREFLLATAAGCALAGIMPAEAATAPDLVLYDPRFPAALEIAWRTAPAAKLQAAAGHVGGIDTRFLAPGAMVSGVTTEAVPFCLQHLIRLPHRATVESRRLDRDLFVWTLRVSA
jgi:hypothetical protein